MARGRKTPFIVEKAIWILHKHFEPGEIAGLLDLPHRTVNHKLKRLRARAQAAMEARKRAEAEERALREAAQADRQRWEAEVLSKIRQEIEQVRGAGQMGPFGGARFRS